MSIRNSYILLDVLNTHVGCKSDHDDVWSDVCGPRGYGIGNDARRELLVLSSSNSLYYQENL